MAEGFVVTDSLNYMLECPVCLEPFTSEGSNVPRILPCYHNLCEKCIEVTLKSNIEDCDGFECPQCKKKHPFESETGVRSFIQNQFILPIIRRKNEKQEQFCVEHERVIEFYCSSPGCQKSICGVCLIKEHKTHDVLDLKTLREEKYKLLSRNIEFMKDSLQSNKEKILEKRKDLNQNLEKCVAQIKIEKETKIKAVTKFLSNGYDDLLNAVRDHRDNENKKIAEDTKAIEEKLKQLDSTEAELNPKTFSLEDVNTKLTTVTEIAAQVQNNLAGARTFKHFEYKEVETSVEDVEKLCGELNETLDEIRVFETMKLEEENLQEKETTVVELEYTVNSSIQTVYKNLRGVSALNNGTVFLWGPPDNEKPKKYRLAQYCLDKGEEVWSSVIKHRPTGASLVRLADKHCLVISYANRHKLEFRDANRLSRVISSHSTADQEPGVMCAASVTTLLYLDLSKTPHPVQMLDCRSMSPQNKQNITHLYHNGIVDICSFKPEEGKDFLLVTGNDGITAINLESGECEWNKNGFLPGMELVIDPWGVAVDGDQNRILVCDHNNSCVQMFSADGEYLGALLKEGERGVGKPGWVSWRMSSKSLIVAHFKNEQWHISDITVQ